MRLAILTSHPIQFQAPLFREISRNMDVTVFFAHRATPEQQAAAGFGTMFDWDVDLLEGYSHTFLSNVAREPGAHHFAGCDTPEIGQKLSAGQFSALLITGWNLKSYWQGIWAAKRRCIPVLVRGDSQLETPRGLAKRLGKNTIYPGLLRLFDAALYVGQRNRSYYEHYHYPVDRLFHSPHCVDNERFAAGATRTARAKLRARLGVGPAEKVVLFAGKLVAFKRPLDLIEAASLVRAQGLTVHIMIAGSGPLEQELRSLSSSMNVPLYMLGFQNQTQMPAAYAAADVLVLPSSGHETWGLTCNEALACGTPVVVSDSVGCAPDLAADNIVGRTFPVGDVRALSAAIKATLLSPPTPDAIFEISTRYSLSAAAAGVTQAIERSDKRVSN
jgi:glycosyltransferase involved in cell wall biosynthesis